MSRFNLLSFRDEDNQSALYMRVRLEVVEQYLDHLRSPLKTLRILSGDCDVGDGWLEIPWMVTIDRCKKSRKGADGHITLDEFEPIVHRLDKELPIFHKFCMFGVRGQASVKSTEFPDVRKTVMALRKLYAKVKCGLEMADFVDVGLKK